MSSAANGALAGQVAVVTGGASGIGAATAERLVAEGARVVVADIQERAAAEVAARLGDAARPVRVDVAVEEDVAAAVDLAVTAFGRLDLMFNNAGVLGAYGPIAKSRMSDVDLTFAINLRGVYLGMKHAARVMIEQGSGVILSTTSPAAVTGGVGNHAYAASKAAVIGLTRSVAAELRPHGIRVNAIMPGAVVSPMTADLFTKDHTQLDKTARILAKGTGQGRALLPADIAAGVCYLASDAGRFITGHTLVIDGGFTAIGMDAPFTKGDFSEPGAILYGGERR